MRGVYTSDRSAHVAEYLRKRIENGLCRGCGVVNPNHGKYVMCDKCLTRQAEVTKRNRELRRKVGRCVSCGNPPAPNRVRCSVCLERVRLACRETRRKALAGEPVHHSTRRIISPSASA